MRGEAVGAGRTGGGGVGAVALGQQLEVAPAPSLRAAEEGPGSKRSERQVERSKLPCRPLRLLGVVGLTVQASASAESVLECVSRVGVPMGP